MLIAMAGLAGSGKDTAAAVLIEEYGYTKIALADAVRDLAYAINPITTVRPATHSRLVTTGRLQDLIDSRGWDDCKRNIPEVRRLLQAVGTDGVRSLFGENFWINVLIARTPHLFAPQTKYVITDCRFKNEGDFVKSSGRGKLMWIERPGVVSDGHASESTELKGMADYIISNDTDLEDLKEDVRFAVFHCGPEYI